jgi:serine/threonine protein kinase
MAAFRKAVISLNRFYETLPHESELANMRSHRIIFPYPTSFTSLDDNSNKTFNYTGHLEEDGGKPKRLIFFGTLSEQHAAVPICIKFVRRYSQDAHLHCAMLGVAPRLRGFETLPGGWYMVVMDEILGYDVLADLPNTEVLPRSVFQAIGEQLKSLHGRQLVHGDVRDTNILVKKDDYTKFMIIDFDWAGVEGVVRYPSYVNYTKIERPHDARDGLLIKAAHDDAMLDFIIDMRAKN